ncbi:MAG: bactofilin family protein [Gemmatimonadaceae bacterium]
MALWKEQVAPRKDSAPIAAEPSFKKEDTSPPELPVSYDPPRRSAAPREAKESVIGSDLTIEGKIDGAGHVRIAGRFKGDVNVEGNLTIEQGAKVTGGVKANSVVIGGELDGNIVDAARVELLESGVLNGDLKAGSLTVAAGSRMRGRAEFGWENGKAAGDGDRGSL